MKRNFLAKAITLGLMLAVPFGVEAENVDSQQKADAISGKSGEIFVEGRIVPYYDNLSINGIAGDTILNVNGQIGACSCNGTVRPGVICDNRYNPDNLTGKLPYDTVTIDNLKTLHIENLNGYAIGVGGDDPSQIGKVNIGSNVENVIINNVNNAIYAGGDEGIVTVESKNLDITAKKTAVFTNQHGTINLGINDSLIEKISIVSTDGVTIYASGQSNINLNVRDEVTIDAAKNSVYANNGNITLGSKDTPIQKINMLSHGRYWTVSTNHLAEAKIYGNDVSIAEENGVAAIAAKGNVIIEANEKLNIEGRIENKIYTSGGKNYLKNISINKDIDDAIVNIKGNIVSPEVTVPLEEKGVIDITLGKAGSQLTGRIVDQSESISMKMNEGTTWNVTGKSNITDLEGKDATISVDTIEKDLVHIKNKNIDNLILEGSGNISDKLLSNPELIKDFAATVLKDNDNTAVDTIKTKEGVLGGAVNAIVDANGNIKNYQQDKNTANTAISNMASISLMTWRQENNDMNKRLGELRDSKGEHGAWTRMARGESKYGAQNVQNQYNYYQVGYDEKLSTNPNWTVGVALTRTEGNSSFTNGSGENKHTGVAVYGSYLKDDGSFIDLIAKYARMDNEFKVNGGVGNCDYETNGYSISAEYGKRFTKDNGFWIEPQVELTYGKVGSASYLTKNGADVHQNGIDSLVGRLGFALGKDVKQGNIYVRASYLYDFKGETDVEMSYNGNSDSFKQDLGGSWWEVGVGTNINLSDATHLYFDVEKTYGGNVATPWQWNAGVRWSF